MAAKRLWILCVLVAVSGLTGCRHWCERHYPCPTSGYPAQACVPCVPCCPPGGASGYGGYAGAVPPPPSAPANFQSSGRMDCTCVPSAYNR